MTLADITLLGKKILIGILVALIPALILVWGLRLTQKLLTKETPAEQVRRSL